MKQLGQVGALLLMATTLCCSEREGECKTLVGSMRSLGRKLTLAQKVTSSENATVQTVAHALRTFAKEASSTGRTLASSRFTIPELEQIATDASVAALALADAAGRMVDASARMKGLEPAQRTARIQRTLADVAIVNIERHCATDPTECISLSKVLPRRPAFPDTAVDPEDAAAWNGRMIAWLDELDVLQLSSPELQHQVANLGQSSKSYATALTALAAGHDSASELTLATQAFSAQINTANAALNAAQDFCRQ